MSVRIINGFEPPSSSTKIWRYFDADKFQSLVQRSAIYFAATHQFTDKFEGSIPILDFEHRLEVLSPEVRQIEQSHRILSNAFADLRRMHKISCWHMNTGESAAMWSLYLREGRGIAIQSTVDRLQAAIKPYQLAPEYTEEDIWLGAVRYIDYKTDRQVGNGFLAPFFHKRRSYAHEQEFRALLTLRLADMFGVQIPPDGVFISVDLQTLCEAIYVAPGSAAEYREQVRFALAEAKCDIPLLQSELDDEALY